MTAEVWSFGGGVQSCAIAALIVTGRLEPPDIAVIADTGREQSTTWDYLRTVVQPALPFPVHVASAAEYATVDLYGGKDGETLLIPAFTTQGGETGKLPGYCSNEWKRRVVERFLRVQGYAAPWQWWLGFSVDEMRRLRHDTPALKYRYPLIEGRLNRGDCMALVERTGWPAPPRSSCWMCPNHTQHEWREIKARPDDWQKAVAFDREIRKRDPHAFVHADCVPLDQADLEDHNESMFDRCESGLCFV